MNFSSSDRSRDPDRLTHWLQNSRLRSLLLSPLKVTVKVLQPHVDAVLTSNQRELVRLDGKTWYEDAVVLGWKPEISNITRLTTPSLWFLSSNVSRYSLRHWSSDHSPLTYFGWNLTLNTPANTESRDWSFFFVICFDTAHVHTH